VARARAAPVLWLHGWVYHLETGAVTAYDPVSNRFVPLAEVRRQQWHKHRDPHQPSPEPWLSM
jgi:hypothetical protein